MLRERKIEPEILDLLAPDDPRALRARRDLQRINALMMQSRIMARLLQWCSGTKPPRVLVELGGGDGTFVVSLAQRLAKRWPGVTVISVDRQCVIAPEKQKRVAGFGWHIEPVMADVFDFLEQPRSDSAAVIMANLILHHLPSDALRLLFSFAQRHAEAFAVCEPRRGPHALVSSKLVWAIGCSDVTGHDAVASVRAGFRDQEISALFPCDGGWHLREHAAFPFTHCFAARRAASNAKDA